jgi:large repetitive protein
MTEKTPRSRAACTLLLAVLATASPAASATAPHLVANLDQEPSGPLPSLIYSFVEVGGRGVLVAETAAEGLELWGTDGTPEGTGLLKDLCPDCSGDPVLLGSTPQQAFYAVLDGGRVPQLWRTDGTTAGTRALTDFFNWTEQQYRAAAINPDGDRLYFPAFGPQGGEVWVSDGTVAGTHSFADPGGPSPYQVAPAAGGVYFLATDAGGEADLWFGDAGSTRLLAHFAATMYDVGSLTTLGTGAVFRGWTAAEGAEPWASDGTAAGTHRLADIAPGAASSLDSYACFLRAGDDLLFSAQEGVGTGLWRTDGTAGGTLRVAPLPGEGFLAPESVLRLGGRVFFTVAGTDQGAEPWVTDGTAAGTHLVRDICPGPCSSNPRLNLGTALGGSILFTADDGSHGSEPWVTDGTAAGTHLVRDICSGGCSSGFDAWSRLGGAALAILYDGDSYQLWRTDGTPAGTSAVADLPPEILFASGIAYGGDLLVVTAQLVPESGGAYTHGKLWKSDGTPGNLTLVKDIEPRSELGSDPNWFVSLGGSALFEARSAGSEQLWISEGTAETTSALTSFQAAGVWLPTRAGSRVFFGVGGSSAGDESLWATDGTPGGTARLHGGAFFGPWHCGFHPLGDRLFFFSPLGADPQDLWLSDGTPEGTRVLSPGVGPQRCNSADSAVLGGSLLFLGEGGSLWRTDGTAPGTVRIRQFEDGAGRAAGQMAAAGDRVFFSAGPGGQSELWVTDGTEQGTRLLTLLAEGGRQAYYFLTGLDGIAYFRAYRIATGMELWRSDGTPEGTRMLKDVRPGGASSWAYGLMAVGHRLYFVADDGVHGEELWMSDGTEAGTRMVVDLHPGPAPSRPWPLAAVGGQLVFSASDGVHGNELWVTDGTADGTRLLGDVAPGPRSSNPTGATVAGDRLYFAADDGVLGSEPWALDLGALAAPCGTSPADLCLQGGRIRVRAHWHVPRTGATGDAIPVPFSSDSGFFWFFDPDNVELVVKVLDGTPVNGHFWTFYGALSDVEYWVEVTDLSTGAAKTYHNPPGEICGGADVGGLTAAGLASSLPPPESADLSPAAATVEAPTEPGGTSGGCAPGDATLCLLAGRFSVAVDWHNQRTGASGHGHTVASTGESGTFYFFAPGNVELVVKMLDGRGVNGNYWFFFGALSDVEYTITVTDTATGAERTYVNPPGNICGRADVHAFPGS